MEPTPTGGSATPSRDPAEHDPAPRDAAQHDPAPRDAAQHDTAERAAARSDAAERDAAERDTDAVEPDAGPTRPGLPTLPQRARGAAERRPARGGEPRRPPGRDPDGRPYGASDEETLNRLLSGLRDI